MAEQTRAAAETIHYTAFVRGLVVVCSIGIRREEHERKQRVRVSVELTGAPGTPPIGDDRRRVINYEQVVKALRDIAASGHIDLCEGFAERVCDACLADPRVERVRATVEKLEVFAEADSVGATIERRRPG